MNGVRRLMKKVHTDKRKVPRGCKCFYVSACENNFKLGGKFSCRVKPWKQIFDLSSAETRGCQKKLQRWVAHPCVFGISGCASTLSRRSASLSHFKPEHNAYIFQRSTSLNVIRGTVFGITENIHVGLKGKYGEHWKVFMSHFHSQKMYSGLPRSRLTQTTIDTCTKWVHNGVTRDLHTLRFEVFACTSERTTSQ